MHKRKTKDQYHIVWHSEYGTEDIDVFDSLKEAREMITEYRLCMPTLSLWIVKRREKIVLSSYK